MKNCFTLVIYILLSLSFKVSSQSLEPNSLVSGKVFRDYNLNSVQDPTEDNSETGQEGILVSIYSSDGSLIKTVLTDAEGSYDFFVGDGYKYKIVFTPPTDFVTSSDLVKFVSSPANDVDLGISRRSTYSGEASLVYGSIFRNGQPGFTQGVDTLSSVVTVPLMINDQNDKEIKTLGKFGTTGAVWGITYSGYRQVIFAAALAKRHSGFGTLGSGGIYYSKAKDSLMQPYFALEDLGIATSDNFKRELPESVEQITKDAAIFDRVGKLSLGGITTSEAGDKLYVMNLFDRSLYRISIPEDLSKPKEFKKISFPENVCKDGILRPFAVKQHEGRIYAGCLCDAEKSQNASDLKGVVFELNTSESGFKQLFSFPLNFVRGKVIQGVGDSSWNPWTNDFAKAILSASPSTATYPQPILSSIDFDADGNMLIGIMDRFGHQAGTGHPDPEGTGTFVAVAGGDVLRAKTKRSRSFSVLDITQGDLNQTGSAKTSYFETGFESEGIMIHQSNVSGGLAVLRSSNQLYAAQHEPLESFNNSGFKILNNKTGTALGGFNLFRSVETGTFGKVNAIGGLDSQTSLPPCVIGNRVWLDRNGNNLQDADEEGVSGIKVMLFEKDALLATTNTNEKGEYQFGHNIVFADRNYRIQLETVRNQVLAAQTLTLRAGTRRWDVDFALPCGSISDCNIEEENSPISSLIVFPNPIKTLLQFEYKREEGKSQILVEVYDMGGSLVIRKEVKSEQDTIREEFLTDRWASGSYVLKVTDGVRIETSKFVKL